MKSKNHRPLGLERLEDRWVPATIRFDGSNLFVSNPTITGGASKLSVIETAAPNTFQVLDGAANNGFYAVSGNITIQGNNAKDIITVKVLGTSGLNGNLSVTTGNSASSITVDSTGAGGFIAGNTRLTMGTGANTVSFGATGLTEKGALFASTRGTGASSFTLSNGASSVLGQAYISGFSTTTLGKAGDTFAGGIFIYNASNPSPSTVTLGGSDLGNFFLTSGQGATSVALNNNVLGNVQVQLANGANSVTLGGGAAAIQLGSLNVNAGNGNNSITLGGANSVTTLGSANLNLGNGTNKFGTSTNFTVNGNLFVSDGNGGLDVATNKFEGVVNGNLNLNLGNGNNAFTLDGAGTGNVLGTWNYNGGNGGNSITVTTQAVDFFTLNIRMGNSPGTGAGGSGNNIFTIGAGAAPGTLTGLIAWGVPSLTANGNAFNDNGYVWMNNITLINLPA